MASETDIANMALSHIGEEANVSSINPPEGSVYADYCARWYPFARDSVIQEHEWSFAKRRIALAQLAYNYPMWQYAYAYPDDCLKVFAILPPEAQNDYSIGLPPQPYPYPFYGHAIVPGGMYTPQEFDTEGDSNGNQIILTNQPNALARYVVRVTDTTKFSPLVVMTISRLLASLLAGPIIKGSEGAQVASGQFTAYQRALAEAITADSQQRRVKPLQVVPWIAGRR